MVHWVNSQRSLLSRTERPCEVATAFFFFFFLKVARKRTAKEPGRLSDLEQPQAVIDQRQPGVSLT